MCLGFTYLCSNIDIPFCNSTSDSEKIAKPSANNMLFILVSSRYGMSFVVSGDGLFSSNRLGKSLISMSNKIVLSTSPCFKTIVVRFSLFYLIVKGITLAICTLI